MAEHSFIFNHLLYLLRVEYLIIVLALNLANYVYILISVILWTFVRKHWFEGFSKNFFVVKTGQRIVSEHSIRTVNGIDLIEEA